MRSSRRWLVSGATVAVVVLTASACGNSGNNNNSATGGTPQQGGTAVWAEVAGASPNWVLPFVDPEHNNVNSVLQFQQLMYRPMLWYGQGTGPQLNTDLSLANPPVYQDNNTTAVVTLKPYAWSNGEKVTAQDVKFWMDLMIAEKTSWANYVPGYFPDNVTSVTVDSPTQVTFKLTDSFSPEWFTAAELAQITPLPLAWDKTSDSAAAGSGGCSTDQTKCDAVYKYLFNKSKNLSTYATEPLWQVVDGPWKMSKFSTDGNVTMVPNKAYSGSVKPKLDAFQEVPFTTGEAEFNVLRAGNTVNVGRVPLADLPQRSANGLLPDHNPLAKYTLEPSYPWAWSYVPINYKNPTIGPAFQQLYVRQALQRTIDQQTVGKVAFRGYAVDTRGMIPTQPVTKYIPDSEKGADPYAFDVDKAKNALTAHGWTEQNGVMTCTSPGNGDNQCGPGVNPGTALHMNVEYQNGNKALDEFVQQWKSDASKAGIDLALNPQPFNTVVTDTTSCPQKSTACNWQVALFGYETIGALPTGDQFFLPGAAVNYSSVNDPKMNELIQKTLHDGSDATFKAYGDYVAQSLPGALNYPDSYFVYAYSRNLTGVAPFNVFGNITPENWAFTK